MTFLQVVNIIRDTALAQPNVNTVVREFLDLNREDTKYSAVVIQDRDGLRDRIVEQDWNTYTFHLGYVDRLTDDEKNRDDIFSTGINVINNIVASIRERWDLEVSIIDRFSTFNQRFTASCAGVYVVLAIQVPVSDCVDTEETNIYEKFSIDITNNGHYHYVPDGRPYGDIDIVVNVENQKPEDHLVETISSNGSYHYAPEEGRVFNEADITVNVPAKTESGLLVNSYYNGTETLYAQEGMVWTSATINTDVHPSTKLVETITSNGITSFSGEWKDADITVAVPLPRISSLITMPVTVNGVERWSSLEGEAWDFVEIPIDVHPSNRLVETITSNGTTSFSGEWKDADITVAVPSDAKPEMVGHFEVTDWGTSYTFVPDMGYVFSEVEVMNATPTRTYISTVTSNGSLRWSSGDGGSLISLLDINVDVHPNQSLAETITSNGSYHYSGEWKDADITVAVSAAKPEESLVETISSNGSYSFSPTAGYVFSDASIAVDVHPSSSLSRSYTTNGTKTITGEFNGGTINISVHPSTSLSRTYTSNGSYNISGEFNGGVVTVAVTTTVTVTMTQAQYNALSVKDSNTIYLIKG